MDRYIYFFGLMIAIAAIAGGALAIKQGEKIGGLKMRRFKKITAGLVTAVTLLGVVPVAAQAEWKESSNGWWYSQGSSYAIGWTNIDGQLYYFDSNGYMKTGWVSDNGNWYYFNDNGAMAHDTTIDGYYLNSTGTISSYQTADLSGAYSCH